MTSSVTTPVTTAHPSRLPRCCIGRLAVVLVAWLGFVCALLIHEGDHALVALAVGMRVAAVRLGSGRPAVQFSGSSDAYHLDPVATVGRGWVLAPPRFGYNLNHPDFDAHSVVSALAGLAERVAA